MVTSHHFRKAVERELKNVDPHSRLLIKNYLNYIDDEITEKNEYIKIIKNRKLSKFQYLFEITIQFITFAFGGFFINAYITNSIDLKIIFITIFYLLVIMFKIKSTGVNQ